MLKAILNLFKKPEPAPAVEATATPEPAPEAPAAPVEEEAAPADGPLTEKEIAMVQSSWDMVKPIQDTAADLFYGKLFELDPSLKAIFPEDMTEQKKKLMQMISTAVAGLTKLNEIVPAVQALGRRHANYKVTAPMYDTVGAALLDTLEKGLGDAWNEPLKTAWTKVYTTLATVMIAAQNEVEPAVA